MSSDLQPKAQGPDAYRGLSPTSTFKRPWEHKTWDRYHSHLVNHKKKKIMLFTEYYSTETGHTLFSFKKNRNRAHFVLFFFKTETGHTKTEAATLI